MLIVDAIGVSYGEFRALRDISLKVDDGQTVIVMGPNGAGKSTLLKGICGLQKIRQGSVSFLNRRIDTLQAYKVAELGISLVPEGGRVFKIGRAHV